MRRLAREAGFHLVGFARAHRIDPTFYDAWLARGDAAGMTYMVRGRDARLDPARLLPGVRSVIALAVNYYHPGDTRLPDGPRISRYAWGRDYHKVLGGRLKRLRRRLEADFPDARHFGGVDAVPILEKYWAQKAGLGWVGKNGNLITRRYGSWVFLATLLTTLDLEPDPPHADYCGSCEACRPACPTDAIRSDRSVDARRCLSYHTIEHRDPWPEEIAGRSEGWLFGCDACQDVCPWSVKFKVVSDVADFAPRPAVMETPARVWAELSEEAWDRKTRGTALRRPGRVGLARNARYAGRVVQAAAPDRDT